MNKTIIAILVLVLTAGCTSQAQVYQSRALEPVKQTTRVDYKTFSNELFTLDYPDEWVEPRHYTEDYYYFQLTDFDPYIHVSVFDIEEFTNTTDYYEIMSELFYWVFDFQELDNYVTEDTMMMKGTMIDEEEDEMIVTYKVVVCGNTALALDVSGLTEEYGRTKDMIDRTVKSFRCN